MISNTASCECADVSVDPRWSGLADLTFED